MERTLITTTVAQQVVLVAKMVMDSVTHSVIVEVVGRFIDGVIF